MFVYVSSKNDYRFQHKKSMCKQQHKRKKPVATAWGALGPLTSVMLVSIIKISMFIELSQGESDQ